MVTLEHTLETTAQPAKVWECCREVERWPEWQEGLFSARLDGMFSPGCSGDLKPSRGTKRHFRIEAIVPGKELVWSMRGFWRRARVTHHIGPCELGTRLTCRVEVQGLGRWLDPWFRRSRLLCAVPDTARRLARLAAQM